MDSGCAAGLAALRTEIAKTRSSIESELRIQRWAVTGTAITLIGIVFTLTRFT